jgi:hypothetical protein
MTKPDVPMLGKHLKLHRMLLRSLPEDMFLMLLSIEVMMMVNACVHSVMSFLLYTIMSFGNAPIYQMQLLVLQFLSAYSNSDLVGPHMTKIQKLS